ncbi:hypothetical protein BD410DRAFT_823702 [Rickenella mellea]|uniref:Adhesin domain-containing protein n=1 Tax=Rickenella mellea TaxID=50990 RepID=A0A4V3AZL8_9AGAM|nr:hypothetical protein BD410DRAFT_823702 [Rickenella mellea]
MPIPQQDTQPSSNDTNAMPDFFRNFNSGAGEYPFGRIAEDSEETAALLANQKEFPNPPQVKVLNVFYRRFWSIWMRRYLAFFTIIFGFYGLYNWWPIIQREPAEFGNSLGCTYAPYFFNKRAPTVQKIPIGKYKRSHFLGVSGDAVGTITVSQRTNEVDNVVVAHTVRTDQKSLLNSVVVVQHDPALTRNSVWGLHTPEVAHPGRWRSPCMRFDIEILVPLGLEKLHIVTQSVTHVRFAPAHGLTNTTLQELHLVSLSPRAENTVHLQTGVRALRTIIDVAGGRMDGSVALIESTEILTQRGRADAFVNVAAMPLPAGVENVDTRKLHTVTGVGQTEITFRDPQRRATDSVANKLKATHISAGNGDVTLRYTGSGIDGLVEIDAPNAWTAEGLNTGSAGEDGRVMRKAGTGDGGDSVNVVSPSGTINLFF